MNVTRSDFNPFNFLEERFIDGPIAFFTAGDYAETQRNNAEAEYKAACTQLDNGNDTPAAVWARKVVGAEFSTLKSVSMNTFWRGLKVKDAIEERSAEELRLVNLCASDFVKNVEGVLGQKRRSSHGPNEESSLKKAEIDVTWVAEKDGVHVPGSEMSVGTMVKRAAVASIDVFFQASAAKQAMIYLGLNSILDLSNTVSDTQFSIFNSEQWNSVQEQFKPHLRSTSLGEDLLSVLAKIEKMAEKKPTNAYQLAKKLECTKEGLDADVLAIYAHCLELLVYHDYLFASDGPDLSEADYVVKLWGPIMERIFRKTKLRCKWGETVWDVTASVRQGCLNDETASGFKVDLRVVADIYHCGTKKEIDHLNAEISKPNARVTKIRTDRTKLLIEAKCILDDALEYLADEVEPVCVSVLQLSGIEGQIVQLELAADGLYIAQDLQTLTIPYHEGRLALLRQTVSSLFHLRDTVIAMANRRENACRRKKQTKQALKRATEKPQMKEPALPSRRSWKRGSWTPPVNGEMPKPPKYLCSKYDF